MDKVKFNLSDNEINSIVYSAFNKDKYWIKSIIRDVPNELKGTVIVLKTLGDEQAKTVELQFLDDRIEVEGFDNKTIIRKLYHSYYKAVCKAVPEYLQEYNESVSTISEFLKEHQEQVRMYFTDFLFEEAGFLSSKLVKNKIEAYRFAGKTPDSLRVGNHVSFVNMRQNQYDSDDREIKIGSVYMTDLNPVVEEEYGGIRPVLVVGKIGINYICVPFSSKSKDDRYLFVGEFNGKKNYAVTDHVKLPISKLRMFQFMGEVDEKIYAEVVELAQKEIAIIQKLNVASNESNNAPETQTTSPQNDENGKAIKENLENYPAPSLINHKSFIVQPRDNLQFEMIQKNLVYPTEEEYLDIVTRRVNELKKKYKLNFMTKGKNKKLDYQLTKDGNVVRIELNYNHQDHSQNYFPYIFEFDEIMVKCRTAKGYRNDAFCSTEYQKLMMQKNDKFYILLFRNFSRSFYHGYQKKVISIKSEIEKAELLAQNVQTLSEILNKQNIIYKGDLESIILCGDRALDLSLVEFEDDEIEKV